MYKHSTQKNHRHILEKHLLPRFGDMEIVNVTRQEIQAYVAHLVSSGYAPKTTDHIHDVLSALLRTAVKWGHLPENPAHDVDLPALTNVRPKWVLTIAQASALLEALPPLPKTAAGVRQIPLSEAAMKLIVDWRERVKRSGADDLMFSTWSGKTDLAEQRRASMDRSSVSDVGTRAGDLVDAATNVLVVGAREGSSW